MLDVKGGYIYQYLFTQDHFDFVLRKLKKLTYKDGQLKRVGGGQNYKNKYFSPLWTHIVMPKKWKSGG